MSFIISEESGTCAALPLRNSWGVTLPTSAWNVKTETTGAAPSGSDAAAVAA